MIKYNKHISTLVILLCLNLITSAEKVEKKGTLANAECKPIGTKCNATSSQILNYTYIYNEPKLGSFSLVIEEQELQKSESLKQVLNDKQYLILSEEMKIEEDVIKTLKMPNDYVVPEGKYSIVYRKGAYTIVFVP